MRYDICQLLMHRRAWVWAYLGICDFWHGVVAVLRSLFRGHVFVGLTNINNIVTDIFAQVGFIQLEERLSARTFATGQWFTHAFCKGSVM